ncbi:7-cyano-7-deazaguanine synthase QueC [Prosthecochloris sp. HL-130-GSB]|uniref:7-cyano-7-deazaguanine synthase n=1 Tax=Prosthecochloris aestuarii TaxID=1102 RepID=A0A831SQ42_PROAE|nr:7-cyano-7-deazaguanine synthase QueC [Prosthecochloris sp. HL-130-GSB]ARM31274.1 7-cyano-7-deazaguanine synthase QueC [Prosthecochloris sp. HL-130-GSB]MBO8092439.1 7-cyano-7-deazaguanine synthase QueC [Prosthecochloris sp.]HED30824.1 7-cyano-7-deazaguanine synthase QueC [Prosthecochloris aestuarii]
MKAVVLLSGGMDSLVALAEARARGYTLAALHVNYGQRTVVRELEAFRRICSRYSIEERLEVNADYLSAIGGSSLTDTSIPVDNADLTASGIPTSYVPFRNGSFLSMAAGWAEVTGAKKIYIGAVEEDSSGYPDCRKVFYDAFNRVIDLGTRPETSITIETPLISMQKADIVQRGIELDVPFGLSWSCYKNQGPACGVCDSCARRLRAFGIAGIEDPIEYEQRPRYT